MYDHLAIIIGIPLCVVVGIVGYLKERRDIRVERAAAQRRHPSGRAL